MHRFQNRSMRGFSALYNCYSTSVKFEGGRKELDNGGRIILPPSALHTLASLNLPYPMMFKLENMTNSRTSHCGVLEFVADEGQAYLPPWMMKNLNLTNGTIMRVQYVSLNQADFVKFEPQSVDFLDITDPKSVLECSLNTFSCLTTGDIIAIEYDNKSYEIKVLETTPRDAVCIVDCDLKVDFAPPVGYVEPQWRNPDDDYEFDAVNGNSDLSKYAVKKFQPFAGQEWRLDGKTNVQEIHTGEMQAKQEIKRGVPNFDHKKGRVNFRRTLKTKSGSENENGSEGFKAFSGQALSLK